MNAESQEPMTINHFPIPDDLNPFQRAGAARRRDRILEQIQKGVFQYSMTYNVVKGKWVDVRGDIRVQAGVAWADEIRQSRTYMYERVPEIYRQTDPQKLPNRAAYDRLMAMDMHARGVVAFGPTGSGKTRAVYDKLMADHYVPARSEDGPCFYAVNAVDLSERVRIQSFKEPDRLAAYLRALRSESEDEELDDSTLPYAELLFIDDLHVAKFTPRYAEELYRIVEHRTRAGRPLLITCQMVGDKLVEKLAGDNPAMRETAEAIVRRIREFCEPVNFGT